MGGFARMLAPAHSATVEICPGPPPPPPLAVPARARVRVIIIHILRRVDNIVTTHEDARRGTSKNLFSRRKTTPDGQRTIVTVIGVDSSGLSSRAAVRCQLKLGEIKRFDGPKRFDRLAVTARFLVGSSSSVRNA